MTSLTPAEASKKLALAHICACETCTKALDVPTADDFHPCRLCSDGQTLLGTAIRLHPGTSDRTATS